jgi:hypothetical protein
MKKHLLTFLALCAFACFSTYTLSAQTTLPYTSCDCPAANGVTAGTPTPPANTTFTLGVSSASDLATTAPEGTGVPDYAFVYSDPAGSIIGLSDDGSFDLNAYAEGTYGVTGFAYDQAQLTSIVGLITSLCAIPGGPVPPAVCEVVATFPSPPTLGDFFSLINSLGGGAVTVPSLVHTMDSVVCVSGVAGLVTACFAVTDSPAYTVDVVGGDPTWDDCDGAAAHDLAAGYSGPYDLTGLTAGGEALPACFFDETVDNSGWVSIVGDGNTYFIYTSPDCGEINLFDEGTYLLAGDAQIAVYAGDCGTLTEIACNEDAAPYGAIDGEGDGYFAGTVLVTEPGVTYYAMIDGFDGVSGQFCLQSVPFTCPNIDTAPETPGDLALCDGESYGLLADFETLNPGLVVSNTPIAVWVVSTEALDEDIFTEFNNGVVVEFLAVGEAPTLFSGNADGVYVASDGTVTTLTNVWVTGLIINNYNPATGDLMPDPACAAEYSAAVNITYYPAGSPECEGPIVPANDECANAIMLDVADGTINGPFSNVGGTGETDLIPAECFGDDISAEPLDNVYDNSVWFYFVGTGETVTLTTSVEGLSSPMPNSDTQVAVYMGEVCGDWTEVSCSDDIDTDGGNYLSAVTVATEAGMMYYVVVDGYYYEGGADAGEFNILVSAVGGGDPLDAQATTTCDALGETYVVAFSVSGGTEPYTVTGSAGVLAGPGGVYLSEPIASGVSYSFDITDANGETITISGSETCTTVEPLNIVYEVTCNELDNNYILSFTITGGTLPYTYSGVVTGDSDTFGTSFQSDFLPSGSSFVLEVVDANGMSATAGEENVCSITPTCVASFGTVTPPADTTYPVGGTSDLIGLDGAATGDYTTVWGITTGQPDLTIVGLSTENPINFGALAVGGSLPAGTYTVHALNILSSDLPTALGALNGGIITNANQVIDAINAGIICAALDAVGFEVTLEETLAPIEVTYDINCDETEGEYTVTFNVSGGSGNYTYSGVLSGSSADLGTTPTAGPFGDGVGFTLSVTDDAGNETTVGEVSVACTKCEYSAGEMSDDLVVDCGTGSLSVAPAVGAAFEGGLLIYVLHTNSSSSVGTVLAVDADDTDGVNFAFGANMEYGATYYVSAIAGPDDDGDGSPDLSSECTQVAEGTPVLFNSEVVVEWDLTCNEETKRGTVVLSVTGGTAPYEVSGNLFNGTYTPGMTVIDVNVGLYEVIATDAYGCTGGKMDSIDCKKPTAVEWRSFSGEVKENGNLLNWATAMEYNNHYFMVQRSLDGNNFTTIATVNGKGNSNQETAYQFLDGNAPEGLAYYQIVQVDYDGKFSSTEVISLTRGTTVSGIVSISPVPAVMDINVVFNASSSTSINVAIFDAAGKMVSNSNNSVIAGVNTLNLNISSLAAGTYFVKINDGNTVAVSKFVKQ